MPIIVFQHWPTCIPGRLGLTLRDHGLALDIRRLDVHGDKAVPTDFDDVEGVISLGGEQNVGDNLPWMAAEVAYLREAHARQLPIVGVCLGHQLLAHALGGIVEPMPTPEWGFHTVKLNPVGQTEPLFAGVPWDCPQFQAHAQEVRQLPPDGVFLASSAACRVQAFRAGLRTYGFQAHFEVDRPMIEAFVAESADALSRCGLTPGDVAAQADRHYAMFARAADRLCVNIASLLFPMQRRLSA